MAKVTGNTEQEWRKIIHVDMDAFYASIEQRDNPEYRGRPIAVGGSRERGVVAAASYEARQYGVYSAMPSVTARKKCPQLIFVKPRMEVYKKVSLQIHEVFHQYTDLVEPLSLDEAFLDVTKNKKGMEIATEIAREMKVAIKEHTGLTASAGVSYNKFLAKIASDYNKPDGLFVIKPQQAQEFIDRLPVNKFFGVGKVTADKMHKLGIATGKDLKKWSLRDLTRQFGKAGAFFYNISRGIDNRIVNPDRERKSIGAERTYDHDLMGLQEILFKLKDVEAEMLRRVEKRKQNGRTLTLKVKFEDFEQITRSKSKEHFLSEQEIHELSVELASAVNYGNKGVRLLGLTLSNFEQPDESEFVQLRIPFDY